MGVRWLGGRGLGTRRRTRVSVAAYEQAAREDARHIYPHTRTLAPGERRAGVEVRDGVV